MTDDLPPEAGQALRALSALPRQLRYRVLCWFCDACYEYIGPGQTHRCAEGSAVWPSAHERQAEHAPAHAEPDARQCFICTGGCSPAQLCAGCQRRRAELGLPELPRDTRLDELADWQLVDELVRRGWETSERVRAGVTRRILVGPPRKAGA